MPSLKIYTRSSMWTVQRLLIRGRIREARSRKPVVVGSSQSLAPIGPFSAKPELHFRALRSSHSASLVQLTVFSMPPKSILKNAPPSNSQNEGRDERSLSRATHHAILIQQQRDIEAQILQAIENLIDFPQSPTADPARPSPIEVERFVELVGHFQPGDYDSLIEERHAAQRCGYALCPRKPRRETAKFRIMRGEDKTHLNIVPREKMEEWCSDDCARRALYIKVQLNEEPAWTRRAEQPSTIRLMVEKDGLSQSVSVERVSNASTIGEESIQKTMENLSLEERRSDSATTPQYSGDVILERPQVTPCTEPSLQYQMGADGHMAIDGYVPKIDLPFRLSNRAVRDKEDHD